MNRPVIISFALSLLLFACSSMQKGGVAGRELSPYDFGLSSAKNGIDRYNVIYKTHSAAIAAGVSVSYKGITSLDLEVPPNAKSIPLSMKNDFNGVSFNVENSQKDFFLFEYQPKAAVITVSKRDIDKGSFINYPVLARGRHLLVISDNNPWVGQREGYSYGHTRKDILLLNNGKSLNKTVMPYDNEGSSPSCKYYSLPQGPMQIKGLTLNRTKTSRKRTYLCSIQGMDDVQLSSITINTPPNVGQDDMAIRINDCTNVVFEDVSINGTYSRTDHSGYGVSMNNIWNFHVSRMVGKGDWGIFGTNNINNATFEDSEINRFDVHCYGRDIGFNNVVFRDKYNQFASVYGTIRFDKCTFISFCPVLNGTSYNAYVGFDLIMNDCVFNATKGKAILIDEGRLDNTINSRKELAERCLPNVTINNLTVNLADDVTDVYLFYFRTKDSFKRDLGYLDNISVSDIKFKYQSGRAPGNFYLSNVKLSFRRAVQSNLDGIDIIGNTNLNKSNRGRVVRNMEFKSNKSILKVGRVKARSIE